MWTWGGTDPPPNKVPEQESGMAAHARGYDTHERDEIYLGTAMAHAEAHGFTGALTAGFLYDTELNFGEDDDVSDTGVKTPGAKSLVAKADSDYGATMPTSFKDKPWEESKWLGYFI